MAALMRSARNLVARGLRASSWSPFNDPVAIDRVLQRANPRWSVREVRATVVSVTREAGNASSLWLRPNGRWRGHAAGQHVVVGVEINGVMHHRAFSLSSAPRRDRLIRLTIRASSRQLVSRWLQDPSRVGSTVILSQAQGVFVLPSPRPDKLLMIAAGSGISPMMAMLEQLAMERYQGVIRLIRIDRQADEVLLRSAVDELKHALPGLQIEQYLSGNHGRIDAKTVAALTADNASSCWLVCGPEGLMDLVRTQHRNTANLPLLQEHFAAPALRNADALADAPRSIVVTGHADPFQAQAGQTLLQAAESAGLNPKFGCRAGICRTCLCQKRRGTARNVLTGVVSDTPDEWIQLCISTAESDLELSL